MRGSYQMVRAAYSRRVAYYPSRVPSTSSPPPWGSLLQLLLLPLLLEHFLGRLLQELRPGPLVHVEVVLDVAVAEHEVLADLDALQVLRAQARHHVDVLDALVGVLGVEVERLPVEDRTGGVLVLVGPAADLDHGLHVGDDELGVLVGHHVGAGDDGGRVGDLDGPVRVLGQVLDHLDLAGGLLQVLEDLALRVDGVDLARRAAPSRAGGRPGRACGRGASTAPTGCSSCTWSISGLSYQSSGIRELDELDVVHGHVVELEHVLDAHVLLDAPPVVLDGVQALGDADLLALEVLHLEDLVAGAHRHAAALVDPGRAQQHGAAQVRVHVDRRVEAAHADQVVEVVDVVRVPVVLGRVAEVGVLHADLLELLAAPAQLLVHVVGGHHGAVGEPDLVPVQRHRGAHSLCLSHRQIPSRRSDSVCVCGTGAAQIPSWCSLHGQAGLLPGAEAALEVGDVLEAHVLERGAGQRRADAGAAVDDHATGRVQLRLVLGARGVGDELEQAAGDLDCALDVVLPLHRLADVQEHGLAGRHLVRRVLRRHGLYAGLRLADHLSDCLRHRLLLGTDARQYEVRVRVTQYLIHYSLPYMIADRECTVGDSR